MRRWGGEFRTRRTGHLDMQPEAAYSSGSQTAAYQVTGPPPVARTEGTPMVDILHRVGISAPPQVYESLTTLDGLSRLVDRRRHR